MPAKPQTHPPQGDRHPRERGQGVVETIVALPAFLLLSCVVLQAALLGVNQILLQYAAFNAARAGSVREGEAGVMREAAKRTLLAAPGSRRFPGPDFSLEVVPGAGKGTPPASPAAPSPLLVVRLTWRSPLLVPVAGPLLGGWRGGGSWLEPVFSLRASWGIEREQG